MKKSILFIICVICLSCNKQQEHLPISNTRLTKEYSEKKETIDLKNWHLKDIEIDTIPGISLERAYDSILKNKSGKEVIVAIIDTEIDISHEDIKNTIWINTDEIPENGIDDDKNGYIDDINGWNFLGNLKGDNIIYASLECVRIIQKFQEEFKGKNIEDISSEKKQDFEIYAKAKQHYTKRLSLKKEDQKYGDFLFYGYPEAKAALKKIYPTESYTSKQLDSLYKIVKKNDKKLAKHIFFISDFLKYNLSEEWIKKYKKKADLSIEKTYNFNYVERKGIDEKPEDIAYKNYGSHYLNKNIDEFFHGTLIAGLIARNRTNTIGTDGIINNIKIMPIPISSYGNEHDKDIALAIRYAVDNGAKVINMSFGKEFSLRRDWVFDAFKYAEEYNVLIVSSAGNSSYNLNDFNNYYPNDNTDNQTDVSDNFLLVGSISNKIDESLLSYYSNYGSIDVDIFAPGENIYTTLPNNKYKFDSGTSLASAITSRVAALIYSHYPNLSASQVKHILMDSGVEYTFNVKVDDKLLPFNTLSKSGKVVNAYNALIMADSISRKR